MKLIHLISLIGVAILLMLALFMGCDSDSPTDNGGSNPTTSAPTVTTTDISSITSTSSVCGGNVTSDGGDPVTARGVCWGLSSTPTISDNFTADGAGTGSFASSISDLVAETQYYVRAYATNNVGTGYGNTRSFTTEAAIGTVTDINGNVYQTVTIGNQVWMAENLKVTHYRNGDPIPTELNGMAWDALDNGAYCEFDNSSDSAEVWGRLYNWYAVNDSRNIAPEGWHVPSDYEWQILQSTLGSEAGNKMKEVGDAHWLSPNDLATNESGFTALAAGMRGYQGHYISLYQDAYYWTSTEYNEYRARYVSLSHGTTYLHRGGNISMRTGCSIRCVKD